MSNLIEPEAIEHTNSRGQKRYQPKVGNMRQYSYGQRMWRRPAEVARIFDPALYRSEARALRVARRYRNYLARRDWTETR